VKVAIMKSKLIRLVGVAIIAAGLASSGVAAAQAAPPTVQSAVTSRVHACRVITVPPTLPWWSCINFFPGTLLPNGCYSHRIYVC
jgi:hypothetical protein